MSLASFVGCGEEGCSDDASQGAVVVAAQGVRSDSPVVFFSCGRPATQDDGCARSVTGGRGPCYCQGLMGRSQGQQKSRMLHRSKSLHFHIF